MNAPIRILIVEDNPDDLILVEAAIGSDDTVVFDIRHAETLARALADIDARPVDVVLLDLSLPDSWGLETLETVNGRFPEIPVVVYTGLNDQNQALDAVKKGAQDYLVKGDPSPTAIIRTLRYAIERQRLKSQLKAALDQVRQLKGLLPICAGCKKIRDDQGYWNQIESYIARHSEAEFSHSICPDCVKKLYPDLDMDD